MGLCREKFRGIHPKTVDKMNTKANGLTTFFENNKSSKAPFPQRTRCSETYIIMTRLAISPNERFRNPTLFLRVASLSKCIKIQMMKNEDWINEELAGAKI